MPLLRCTNNGLTCWIDSFGRIRQFLEADGNIYGPGVMQTDLPLKGASRRPLAFYHEHGDVFGWICVVVAVARTAWWMAGRFRMGPSGPKEAVSAA